LDKARSIFESTRLEIAAAEHRALIESVLDSKLVDETAFLKGVSEWLAIPWWDEPIISVLAPLREKIPAKTGFHNWYSFACMQVAAKRNEKRPCYVSSTTLPLA
jgi:hypothetical protein